MKYNIGSATLIYFGMTKLQHSKYSYAKSSIFTSTDTE